MSILSFCRKLAFLAAWLVVAPVAAAATDTGSLTPGSAFECTYDGGLSFFKAVGFDKPAGFGTYSPTGLTGGESVAIVFDQNSDFGMCLHPTYSLLEVSGFSVDPGQDWLTSITCNSVENTGSGAASFNYSSGTATWTWTKLFSLVSNTSTTCNITHS
jgi:hypothetical protein